MEIVLALHLVITVALIAVVLLQRSEGGALGIGGGGGGGGGMVSARGAANALTRTTTILGGCFFLTSILLTLMALDRDAGTVDLTAPSETLEDTGEPVPPLDASPLPSERLQPSLPGGLEGSSQPGFGGSGVPLPGDPASTGSALPPLGGETAPQPGEAPGNADTPGQNPVPLAQ